MQSAFEMCFETEIERERVFETESLSYFEIVTQCSWCCESTTASRNSSVTD